MTTTTTRVARCQCGVERPSDPSLPFFEDRSAGTQSDRCRNCRYFRAAHAGPPRPFVCGDFQPMLEGYPADVFYCGCAGLD